MTKVEKGQNTQWRKVKIHSGEKSEYTVEESKNTQWRKVKIHSGEKSRVMVDIVPGGEVRGRADLTLMSRSRNQTFGPSTKSICPTESANDLIWSSMLF